MMRSFDVEDPLFNSHMSVLAPRGQQRVLISMVDNDYTAGGATLRLPYAKVLDLMEFLELVLDDMEETGVDYI